MIFLGCLEEVWPWLVQVGYWRADWYAGDPLENFRDSGGRTGPGMLSIGKPIVRSSRADLVVDRLGDAGPELVAVTAICLVGELQRLAVLVVGELPRHQHRDR
jgi:hypothetical protein